MRTSLLPILLFCGTAHAQDAVLDPTFNPTDVGFGMGDGAKGSVHASVILPDGKILIGGEFQFVDGIPYKNIARLNADGSVDQTFLGGVADGNVDAMVLQPDGRIIIAGGFTSVTSIPAIRIARIFADGTLDPSFDAGIGFHNGAVLTLAHQPDGRIIAGGSFDGFGGAYAGRIVRLNTDGSRDLSFNTGIGFDHDVLTLAIAVDGKVLVGGRFGSFNGDARTGIARLNMNGSVDTAFMNAEIPGIGLAPGGYSLATTFGVYSLGIRPSGEIVLGGSFGSVNGVIRADLAQVDQWTGAVSSGFIPSTPCNTTVFGCFYDELLIMPDGGVLVGGLFQACATDPDWFGSLERPMGLARFSSTGIKDNGFHPLGYTGSANGDHWVRTLSLFPDGSVFVGGGGVQMKNGGRGFVKVAPSGLQDETFHAVATGADAVLRSVVIAPDDAVYIGGDQASYQGVRRHGVAKLNADGQLDQTYDAGDYFPFTFNFIWWTSVPFRTIMLQQDGKLIRSVRAVGSFVRIMPGGGADPSFSPPFSTPASGPLSIIQRNDGRLVYISEEGVVLTLELNGSPAAYPMLGDLRVEKGLLAKLPDDRIYLAGDNVRYIDPVSYDVTDVPGHVHRLLENGTLDPAFTPPTLTFSGSTRPVNALVAQPDGSLIIAGAFTHVNGTPMPGLARIDPTGTLDLSFSPGSGTNAPPLCLALRPDGRLIAGGAFTTFNGTASKFLVQLMPDGSLDPTYTFGTNFGHYVPGDGAVVSVALQSDGRLLVAGDFTSYAGSGRNRLLRLQAPPPVASLSVTARVFLEGAMDGMMSMRDDLRAAGYVPLTEPYTALGFPAFGGGGEQTTPFVLSPAANTAVVDWIHVQLRSVNDPTTIVATRNGLLTTSGFIVDVDGFSPLSFPNVPVDNYHVAVIHRNHLGVMTNMPVQPLSGTLNVDFSQPYLQAYGTEARKYVFPNMLLWSGDVNHDGELKYTGPSNDRDPILVSVGGGTPNNSVTGYKLEDINMDGVVRYTGQNNDRDPILVNVGGSTPNSTRQEQLP